jgi:outer membrane murein-binding lipoprotein Lpp
MTRSLPVVLAMALLLSGCASDPPPPPGPTMEEFEEVSGRLEEAQVTITELREQVARARVEARAAREAAAVASLDVAKAQVEQKRLARELAGVSSSTDGARPGRPETDPPPRKPDAPYTSAHGSVVAVDEKMGVYLVSLGENRGVKSGDELTVHRDAKFVAIVIVDKVFEDKASVRVKVVNGKPLKKSDIQTGDKVGNVL